MKIGARFPVEDLKDEIEKVIQPARQLCVILRAQTEGG
jgi:hypothetical protein